MPPVHADLMDRSVCRVRAQVPKYRCQEADEIRSAHLAAAHCKVLMANPTEATDMAIDRDVVGRVGEHKICLGAAKQGGVGARLPSVATNQAMPPQLPLISRTGNRLVSDVLRSLVLGSAGILGCLTCLVED